jgi:sugar fermentation stimulation protein A
VKFKPLLQRATFLKRYQRFLADVKFADGTVHTVHCPNTGSMRQCLVPNSPCWLSHSDNPKRKYAYTWEIATAPGGTKAGIHSARANTLVVEAIENGVVAELQGYRTLRQEVSYGRESSRIDLLLQDHPRRRHKQCYVEVKNVTYADDETKGRGLFPDAISIRGTKHLRELMAIKADGHRAVLFYCVQHTGIDWVEVARDIDPQYAKALQEAARAGVEVIAYRARLSANEIALQERLPFKP